MNEENNTHQRSTEDIEECRKQRDEYLSGWQRAKADLVNYKKDEARRFEAIARYATAGLLRECITVLDSFDLAIAALEKQGPVEKGVYMIKAQIEDVLKKQGLERISVKTGDEFNPAIAEAIAEGESDAPPGTILEEIEPGYRVHDKILRPARVRIARPRTEEKTSN